MQIIFCEWVRLQILDKSLFGNLICLTEILEMAPYYHSLKKVDGFMNFISDLLEEFPFVMKSLESRSLLNMLAVSCLQSPYITLSLDH